MRWPVSSGWAVIVAIVVPPEPVEAQQPVWPGNPFPFGATWDGAGTNFSVWSSTATGVTVCLFDRSGNQRLVPLTTSGLHTWHGYLPGIGPGQRYGLRVAGPYDPARGLRHNPAKLLLDPYARAIDGAFRDHPAVYDNNQLDSAPYVPRSVVVRDDFPWSGDRPPNVAWEQLVVYEMHVKGFTARHPGVPENLRGTFAGIAQPAVVDYLTDLGITAVELLPVQHFVSEPALQQRGLTNYWGYNTLGYFAPHQAYASRGPNHPADAVREFKVMVRTLHAAGIEVILDVVYNHTAEGGPNGPLLCFRGIDNPNYYRLDPADASRYLDYTGCGNTFDARRPHSLQLIMDSLRYWVTEMHVDGFRFDLASALARSLHDVDKLSAFFDTIHQDPVVSRVKLIAEPWDIGAGGYQVGEFPPLWTEWNGKYRDTVRDFWRGQGDGVRELAYRLTGSSDLYADDGRTPFASINFVTAHDGFTLRDLVSYNHKHNAANGEDNRDGTDDNRSDNHGTEGPTDDVAIDTVRRRQARNLLATLMLSTGAPMLLAGDEQWHTQAGNNNAFAQDNGVSWLDWEAFTDPAGSARSLHSFVAQLIALRRAHPVLRQRAFFEGRPVAGGDGAKDLAWFRADGGELSARDWFSGRLRTLGMYVDGRGLRERDLRGRLVVDDSFLLLAHAEQTDVAFTLPGAPYAGSYRVVISTAEDTGLPPAPTIHPAGSPITVTGRSLQLLQVVRDSAACSYAPPD